MTDEACILTTKDFTILEVMRERCLGRGDPLVPILDRKLKAANVVLLADVPAEIATLSSRVTYSVDRRDPDTRVLSHDRMTSTVGMFLPITTIRGLALLGLREGQAFIFRNGEAEEECVLLMAVHYQPEAAKREKEALALGSVKTRNKPTLRLIRGANLDQLRLRPSKPDASDDPGPSAA